MELYKISPENAKKVAALLDGQTMPYIVRESGIIKIGKDAIKFTKDNWVVKTAEPLPWLEDEDLKGTFSDLCCIDNVLLSNLIASNDIETLKIEIAVAIDWLCM